MFDINTLIIPANPYTDIPLSSPNTGKVDKDYNPNKPTRLEVIDSNGRQYTNYNVENLELSYQDKGKTLKIFIK